MNTPQNQQAQAPTQDAATAIIFAGGDESPRIARTDLPDATWIIAADSGLDHALRIGMTPNLLVGDLDSVSNNALAFAQESEIESDIASTDKDLTDTEMALAHAVRLGATRVIVVSAGGGRLDHAHGLLSALFNPAWSAVQMEAIIDSAHVHVAHGPGSVTLNATPGDLIGLHAMNGTAFDIRTNGLRWTLDGEDLSPWVSRGVSNEFSATQATISLQRGSLMIVQPLLYSPLKGN